MLLILLIAASGCVTSGKTVIKSKVLITESEEGVPEIVSIDVSTETVSALRKYQESPMCIPGVYMKCIQSTGGIGGYQIDYWRSVEYTGAGEYEILSELKKMHEKGDRIDVTITIEDVDETGSLIKSPPRKTKQFRWDVDV